MVNFIKIKNNTGQSLIEALVAIFIILGAVISTLTLVISSINAGRVSTDKLIASSLAREGLEIVRNIRDSNWLDEDALGWFDEIIVTDDISAIPIVDEDPLDGLYGLDFDVVTDFNTNCGGDKCSRIYQKDNLYLQKGTLGDGWQPTKFYRLLTIKRICWDSAENETIQEAECPADELVGVSVISEVRWPTPNSDSNVLIEERIYDWRL